MMDDTQPNGFVKQRETPEETPLKAIILNALQTQTYLKINELYEICRPTLPSPRANQTHDSWLFEINFLLMNALFELQIELLNDGLFLDVDAMQLQLLPLSTADSQAIAKSTQSELRAYYLDWRNLEQITAEEINTLLNDFWQRYLAGDKRTWALETLGLAEGASKAAAQAAYRRLASRTHPDRGGNPEEFLKVREAWEILSRVDG
jgi:hypothetical protein